MGVVQGVSKFWDYQRGSQHPISPPKTNCHEKLDSIALNLNISGSDQVVMPAISQLSHRSRRGKA